jgi:hypothetical protein
MLSDFLRFCMHHGFGGLALLPLAGWAVLTVSLAILATVVWALYGVTWVSGRFGEGFRRAVRH